MSLESHLKALEKSNKRLKRNLKLRLKPDFGTYELSLTQLKQLIEQEKAPLQLQLQETLTQERTLMKKPEEDLRAEHDALASDLRTQFPEDPYYYEQLEQLLTLRTKIAPQPRDPTEQLTQLYILEQTLAIKLEAYNKLLQLTTQTHLQLKIARAFYQTSKTSRTFQQSLDTLTDYLKEMRTAITQTKTFYDQETFRDLN